MALKISVIDAHKRVAKRAGLNIVDPVMFNRSHCWRQIKREFAGDIDPFPTVGILSHSQIHCGNIFRRDFRRAIIMGEVRQIMGEVRKRDTDTESANGDRRSC